MKYAVLFCVAVWAAACTPPSKTTGSDATPSFDVGEAGRIIEVLASDAMRGRRAFSPEIDRAADFIAEEFRAAGLQPLQGNGSFRQEFSMLKARQVEVKGTADGKAIEPASWIVFTSEEKFKAGNADGYDTASIKAEDNFGRQARAFAGNKKNYLVRVDKKHAASFGNLSRLKSNFFKSDHHVIYFLGETFPAAWSIEVTHEVSEQKLSNVVAVLPGRRASEYVVFSAHYDHVGVGKPVNGDSIFNGANDDASGVVATILLAKHFAKLGPQERTLVFAAFTAEEVGGFGSQYFSRQLNPDQVVAMFNIEMIGTESKWGKNSAFITGYEKSNLGALMQKNLEGSGFTFYPDPYPQQQLFYRSDNATLARLGVPAHTISTAKMENEPHYHQVTDEVNTLDLANMAKIIESIAVSAKSLVEGKETPTRVDATGLN